MKLFALIGLIIHLLTAHGSLDSPPGLSQPAIAYDAAHNEILVFGGSGEDGMLADTWIWDWEHWKHVEAPGPPARTGHSMTFAYVSNTMILFGGYGPERQRLQQYVGVGW